MEFFEPVINAMCGAIDTPHQCVSSSATAFFIQRTDDSYYRLTDAHDTMVLQLAGQSTWRIFKRFTLQPAGDPETGIVMKPGDALYLRNGTPHEFAASDTHALHLSFEIYDQGIGADTALKLLAQQFDLNATRCYTPTEGVIEKLIEHARTPAFRSRIDELQATQTETCRRGRTIVGTNRVTHFSRLIAIENDNLHSPENGNS